MIFYGMLLVTALNIGLSLLGIVGEVSITAHYGRGNLETRYMLGFNHANNLHDVVWYLLAIVLLLTHEKWDWKHCVLETVGNVGLFFLTISRNGLIAVQLLLISCFVIKYLPKIREMRFPYVLGGLLLAICLWMTWQGIRSC